MKVLLTGASSFSGYWFARALHENGFEILAPLRAHPTSYSGARARRVARLEEFCTVVPGVIFGSSEFVDMVQNGSCDILCHHAANVTDYRSDEFDLIRALGDNVLNFRRVSELLSENAFKAVVFTGSVFEQGEGAGTAPLDAFSPYGLSKSLTSQVVAYWCKKYDIPFGKFVIPNPFGPLEEPRFCSYLLKTWAKKTVAEVRTPDYVRDNIHIELLSKAYAAFVSDMAKDGVSRRFAPSGYVETQGAFAARFSREMSKRLMLDCELSLLTQTDFSEPLIRINTDYVDAGQFGWEDRMGWDSIADDFIRGSTDG